jgi:hypothetical protein
MLNIKVVINVADPSQVAILFLLLYLLCGKDLLYNNGGKKNVNQGVEIKAFSNRHVFYIGEEACCVVAFVSVGASGVSTQQIHAMCKPVA